MNKTRYLLLCFLILFPFITVSAQDAEITNKIFGDWEVISNDTGWTITAYRGNDTDITVPASFDNINVTKLGPNLFMNDLFLERIVLPSAVTEIGSNAFNGCVSLKEVSLPYLIRTVAESTFKGCRSLENIVFPSTLTSLGKTAFYGCESLTSIRLPQRVSSIGESVFENCTSLSSVTVQRSLATVGANAFKNTAWLDNQQDEFVILGRGLLIKYNGNDSNVTVPLGVVAIADAFSDNTKIEKVTLPETVRRIMQNAFKNAVNLREINIPPWLTTIGVGAFSGCESIPSFELPVTLTSIGSYAFEKCNSLTELIIPTRVKSIPALIAPNCKNLQAIRLHEDVTRINKNSFSDLPNTSIFIAPDSEVEAMMIEYDLPYSYYQYQSDDYIYTKNTNSIQIIRYIGNESDVVIPETIDDLPVTGINKAAFQNNSSIKNIFLPNSVVEIGDWAFSYMESLEYIELPDRLQSLGNYVFIGTGKLEEIKLPSGLETFGKDFFDSNPSTIIFAAEGSKIDSYLKEIGYIVFPEDLYSPREKPQTSGKQIEQSGTDADNCGNCQKSFRNSFIEIPEGVINITHLQLDSAENELYLLVPGSVQSIDMKLLEGHNVTIISDTGTYAEEFAFQNKLKFLVSLNLWTEL